MPNLSCPLPRAIDHQAARDLVNKLRRENPGMSPATLRREAARQMDTDYDTFLKAWKKPKAPKSPIDITPDLPRVTPKTPTPVRTPELPRPTFPTRVVHEEIRMDDLDDIEASGVLKAKPNDLEDWEQDEDIVNCVVEGRTNCTQCTLAWELRQRGWDVTAKDIGGKNFIQFTDYYGASPYDWKFYADFREADKSIFLRDMPDGARGAIQFGRRYGRSGHIFNWKKENGHIVYYDAQTGDRWDRDRIGLLMQWYFPPGEVSDVKLLRMDSLRIPKKALEWIDTEG